MIRAAEDPAVHYDFVYISLTQSVLSKAVHGVRVEIFSEAGQYLISECPIHPVTRCFYIFHCVSSFPLLGSIVSNWKLLFRTAAGFNKS